MAIDVDLYSDTQTRPTREMRQAMCEAQVGDEQRGEDPTTNRLCDRVAELLGKESAIYLPSGTMCNEIAYRVHCQPGDEIILDETSHALHFEVGGPAALAGVMTRTLAGDRGMFQAHQVRTAIRPKSRHHPRTRLLSVENTANLGGGAVWDLTQMNGVTEVAKSHGLATHLDGARLLNAVIASGITAETYCAEFDSVWLDLSKGLGAPVGAVLAGDEEFIEEAWRFKHQFGGAMRQSGIIAAAGLYALDHHVERLAEDHANAQKLAAGLSDLPHLSVDADRIDTNMVYITVTGDVWTAPMLSSALLEKGLRIGAMGESTMRAVTHLDVASTDIDKALNVVRSIVT